MRVRLAALSALLVLAVPPAASAWTWPVDRPRPGRSHRGNGESEKHAERGEPDAHDHLRVVSLVNEKTTVPEASAVVKRDYRDVS